MKTAKPLPDRAQPKPRIERTRFPKLFCRARFLLEEPYGAKIDFEATMHTQIDTKLLASMQLKFFRDQNV